MSGSEQVSDPGVISGDAFVDFSHMTSADDLAAVSRIEGVAAVVVPESLAAAYARIPSSGVAATVFVPHGAAWLVVIRRVVGALVDELAEETTAGLRYVWVGLIGIRRLCISARSKCSSLAQCMCSRASTWL